MSAKRPDHIDDELIASYLTGEATPEVRARVADWINQSEANRRYFEQSRLIFDKAAAASVGHRFDTDQAWEKIRARISAPREAKTVKLNFGYRFFMQAAAGLVILLGVGLFTYSFFRTEPASISLVSENTTESDTLPEGTNVFLNRHTKVEYTLASGGNTHVVRLQGEAYFDINHEAEKTFVVEALGTFVKDIGTAFNVNAYPDSSFVEVVVDEGEVVFYTEGNPGIHLKASERGIYDKATGTFRIATPEPNVTAYKTKAFSFSNDALAAVVETLNRVYDQKIHIDDNLKACKLTVSFHNEKPEEIAGVIAETLGLTMSQSEDGIWLKGQGCTETTP